MPKKIGKFEMHQTSTAIDILFSSCLKNIDAVCRIVTKYLLCRLPVLHRPDHLFAVNLVMREALTNAVLHGNKNDPTKDVRFVLKTVGDTSIHLAIEDQGNGFDWRKYQGFALPASMAHGRGISIMETYFTRYAYNEKGNKLFLQMDFTP